jgi:hypothetical protein
MNMPQVTIIIDGEGHANVEAKGYKGASCKEVTAAIEKALGMVKEDQLTPEFRQGAAQSAQNRAVQR